METIKNLSESLAGIGIFAKVAETGSFTHSASVLGLSVSGVSKAVTRLEARLGVRLVNRTTRGISLTHEGSVYQQFCRRVIADVELAEQSLGRSTDHPAGHLRVQLPRGIGHAVVVEALGQFLDLHPNVTMDVLMEGRDLNLAEEGIDVALRYGEPPDSRMVARRLCGIDYLTCASPDYLARHGEPTTIDELSNHRCINYIRPQSGRYRGWELNINGQTQSIPVHGTVNFNDTLSIMRSAVSGTGIAYLPDFLVYPELVSGRLKVVLQQHAYHGPRLYLTYFQNRQLPARVRAFIAFVVELLPDDPPWRTGSKN